MLGHSGVVGLCCTCTCAYDRGKVKRFKIDFFAFEICESSLGMERVHAHYARWQQDGFGVILMGAIWAELHYFGKTSCADTGLLQ